MNPPDIPVPTKPKPIFPLFTARTAVGLGMISEPLPGETSNSRSRRGINHSIPEDACRAFSSNRQ